MTSDNDSSDESLGLAAYPHARVHYELASLRQLSDHINVKAVLKLFGLPWPTRFDWVFRPRGEVLTTEALATLLPAGAWCDHFQVRGIELACLVSYGRTRPTRLPEARALAETVLEANSIRTTMLNELCDEFQKRIDIDRPVFDLENLQSFTTACQAFAAQVQTYTEKWRSDVQTAINKRDEEAIVAGIETLNFCHSESLHGIVSEGNNSRKNGRSLTDKIVWIIYFCVLFGYVDGPEMIAKGVCLGRGNHEVQAALKWLLEDDRQILINYDFGTDHEGRLAGYGLNPKYFDRFPRTLGKIPVDQLPALISDWLDEDRAVYPKKNKWIKEGARNGLTRHFYHAPAIATDPTVHPYPRNWSTFFFRRRSVAKHTFRPDGSYPEATPDPVRLTDEGSDELGTSGPSGARPFT